MHRSVSQYNSYRRCPMAYKLSRIDGVWSRPAAWLPQGSAVHEAAEAWERSGRTMTLDEAQTVFAEAYKRHSDTYCETTPNLDWWFQSGPYKARTDLPRRFEIGLGQVEKYVDWYTSHPEEKIWITPDGEPAIELGFDIELGSVPVRGFIDAVIDRDGELIVRDNKTGNNPGDDFQLGVYKVAIELTYGAEALIGDYWMGRAGKPTHPFDLSDWTVEAVTQEFEWLEEGIRSESFDPDPEPSRCNFCDVAYFCQHAVY